MFSVGMLGHIEIALGAREAGLGHLRRMLELAHRSGLLLALSVALDYCAEVALADVRGVARERLPAEESAAVQAAGRALSLDEAVAEALAVCQWVLAAVMAVSGARR